MRVTPSMLHQRYLSNLNRNIGRLQTYQEQLATNRRINRLSDDPIGAAASLSVRGRLSRINQYEKNIGDARSRLTQTETAAMELNEVIKTLYQKTVQAANSTMTQHEKQVLATEMADIRDHVVQLANTTFRGQYLFGGYQTSVAPFEYGVGVLTYQGMDVAALDPVTAADLTGQVLAVEVGQGLTVDVSFTGLRLLGSGPDHRIAQLDDLIAKLQANAPVSDVETFISDWQAWQNDVLSIGTEIGSRINRLDLMSDRYGMDKLNYEAIKSDLEDIDMAETVMRFQMSESVYTAALALGSRILQPSLVDFLR